MSEEATNIEETSTPEVNEFAEISVEESSGVLTPEELPPVPDSGEGVDDEEVGAGEEETVEEESPASDDEAVEVPETPDSEEKGETPEVTKTEEPEVPSESQQEPEVTEEAIRNYYKGIVNADEVFDDETADALANVATKLHQTVLQTIDQQLAPRIVQTIAQQQEAAQIEEKFYSEWPELKTPEAQETVMRLASAYRQANPKVSVEQSIQEIGAAAMMSLGYSRTPSQPTKPARKTQQFKPSGVRSVSRKIVSDNEFAQLADDDFDV